MVRRIARGRGSQHPFGQAACVPARWQGTTGMSLPATSRPTPCLNSPGSLAAERVPSGNRMRMLPGFWSSPAHKLKLRRGSRRRSNGSALTAAASRTRGALAKKKSWAAAGNARCRLRSGSADKRQSVSRWLAWLATITNAALRRGKSTPDQVADMDIFHKGVVWALRYDTKFTDADIALLQKALQRGRQRAEALAADKQPWQDKKGRLVRGYVSAVDGSTQPYGLIVPAGYDPKRPMRLDVVLHGSSKPVGMSELRFLKNFDDGDDGDKVAPEQDYIELHPLGRVENCYRWAGETDVFEAIEAVCRHYAIDRDRIVLRGMSMGASGTWHLGLKHPDRFVALGPYCGYVDTHHFSETPLDNFVKVGALPAYQEKTLHMLDSIDYAANAGVVPAVACMGEKDVFFQAHVLMGQAMEKEGLKMVNLISPGTGHVIDPATHKEQMKRIGEYATKGIDHAQKHLRFVTWTLKYSRCHWLQILGMGEHYVRAELEAEVAGDGAVTIKEPKNVTRFAVLPPVLQGAKPRLRVGDDDIALPAAEKA